MKSFLKILLSLSALFFAPGTMACDCIMKGGIAAYLADADQVVVGRVVELVYSERGDTPVPDFMVGDSASTARFRSIHRQLFNARIAIHENIKYPGPSTDTLFVIGDIGDNCLPVFTEGQQVLLFLERLPDGTYLPMGCTPWRYLGSAKEELDEW